MNSEDPPTVQSVAEAMDVSGEESPIKKEAVKDQPTTPSQAAKLLQDLPKNRFELELEFVQSLASPAYLHYLATNPSSDDHNWLDDPEFVEYLRYLFKVWTRPEYNRFLVYPQALYFLEWMLNHRREEWAQVAFRNFAHQQQFLGWQHRATRLYGRGSTIPGQGPKAPAGQPQDGPTLDPQTGMEVGGDTMKEG
jgi:mediator of RNA polymerase II transcription subunit 31